MREVKRLLLLRRVAEFTGPPRERLALRHAVGLFEVRFDSNPVDDAQRRIDASRVEDQYRNYSPEFRALYRAIIEHFTEVLTAQAAAYRALIERLDADSVVVVNNQKTAL